MSKKIFYIFAIFSIAISLAACTSQVTVDPTSIPATSVPVVEPTAVPPTVEPTPLPPTIVAAAPAIKVTDFRGKEITLEKSPEKIACVLDNVLNDLYMLGVVDQVVAVHHWTLQEANPGYTFMNQIDPRIGKGELPEVNGNAEKIISLHPDIVIMWAQEDIIPTLEQEGIIVYGVQVNTFDDANKLMEDLGKITGKEDRAKEIIDYTQNQLKDIQTTIGSIPDDQKPKGMFVWGPTTLDVAGVASTGNAILTAAGSTNVTASENQEHFVASMEQVVNWNPDAILIWATDKLTVDDYLTDASWQGISAVNNKQVYMFSNGFYTDLWTPKYMFAIKSAAKWLYPDKFTNINLDDEQKSMLKDLYQFDFK